VNIRFRPLMKFELDKDPELATRGPPFQLSGNQVLDQEVNKKWNYDTVMPYDTTQEQMYNAAAKGYVTDLMEGFNVTIFAYGTTGSGKTHTMQGDENSPGITPRMVGEIFEKIETYAQDRPDDPRASTRKIEVLCSYFEIYNEHVNDLIEPHNKNVQVRLIKDRVIIEPLTKMKFTSAPAVMEFIRRGNGNRRVTATAMNPESSRSHSVFQLELRVMDSDGAIVSHPTLILADLAGSEDPRKSGVKGAALTEAININLSLGGIAACIKSLTTGASYVPYRDYQITTVLKSALGGDSKVSLIVACNPHPSNKANTVSALRFATQCKKVKNKVVRKVVKSVSELEAEVEKLQAELATLRALLSQWEKHEREVHPDCGFKPQADFKLGGDEEEKVVIDSAEKIENINGLIEDTEAEIKEITETINDMEDGPDKEALVKELESKKLELGQLHQDREVAHEAVQSDTKDTTVKIGGSAEFLAQIADLQAENQKLRDNLEAKDGDLTALNTRIEVLDKENEGIQKKFSGMKKAYEGQLNRAMQDKKDSMADAENAMADIEHLLDAEKMKAQKFEKELEDLQHLLSNSKSETLKAQQETHAMQQEKADLQNAMNSMKTEAKAVEDNYQEIMKTNEQEHVAEMNEAREKSETEKTQLKADLNEEIERLKASLQAVQVDSGKAAEETTAAWERQVAALKEEIERFKAEKGQWHFVAVTHKSQLRSAQTKATAAQGKLETARQQFQSELAESSSQREAIQQELNTKALGLQHAQEQLSKKEASENSLIEKLQVSVEENEVLRQKGKEAAEEAQAYKNMAQVEVQSRQDLEDALGGVDVYQRAIKCNALEMEVSRLTKLNWILDYQLRSATHGIVVDVTTYEPRALLAGWMKRKGTFTYSNKYFRTEWDAEKKSGNLMQYDDDQKETVEATWSFGQVENIVFDIEDQIISLYLHGFEKPIILKVIDQDSFYAWANYLYFRVFPPSFDF